MVQQPTATWVSFTQVMYASQFPRSLTMPERATAVGTFEIVPLLRLSGIDATDEAAEIMQVRIAFETDPRWRWIRRTGGPIATHLRDKRLLLSEVCAIR